MSPVPLYSTVEAKGWLPWTILAPLVCVALVAAPVIGISLTLEHFGLVDDNGDPLGLTGLYAFLLAPFAGIALAVALWICLVERRPLATVGLVGPGAVPKFLGGVLIGIGMIIAIVAAIWLAGGEQAGPFAKAFAVPGAATSIALLFVSFAWQSSVEEFVFRGWLLSVISRRSNVTLGIILSSLTFTFLHYAPRLPLLDLFNTLLFAIFLACWAVKAGSIWGVMGWHGGWNWLCATGFELPVTGIDTKMPALLVKLTPRGPQDLTGGSQGPEGSLACTLVLMIAIAFVLARRSPNELTT